MKRVLAVGIAASAVALGWLALRAREGDAEPAGARGSAPAVVEERRVDLVKPAERALLPPSAWPEEPGGDLGDEELPPTPAHPGPGEARLRVEVVALESGQPLAGVGLDLFPTDDGVVHEWRESTQPDPSRGLDNDFVETDAGGRCEFIVQSDFGYTLRGRGENGLAAERELPLEPFAAGEERALRLELATAWTLEWHGRVVDRDGGFPIVGAEVTACAHSAERIEDLHVLARARTDGDGRVVLRLPAWEPALALANAPSYFVGGGQVDDEALAFESAQELGLGRPARLTGTVVDEAGRAVAGVRVRLWAYASQLVAGAYSVEVYEWIRKTDEHGRCAFDELPSAVEMSVELAREGDVQQRPLDDAGRRSLTLTAGETRTARWVCETGAIVRGTVRDQRGAPLRGIALVLGRGFPHDDPSIRSITAGRVFTRGSPFPSDEGPTTLADREGRFAFGGVFPGDWLVGPHAREEALPPVVFPLRVEAGTPPPELEIVLDVGCEIRGVVLGPDGAPVQEVAVRARGAEPRLDFVRNGAESDHTGAFVIEACVAGTYLVDAMPADPLHRGSEPVDTRTGESVELRLRWAGIARGTVVDADGAPVDARVSCPPHAWAEREFDFAHLAPGRHDFFAVAEGGLVGVLRALPIAEREVRDDLVITVEPGAQLTVTTRDEVADGRALVEVVWEGLSVVPASGGERTHVTFPAGTVLVRWLRRGYDGKTEVAHEEQRTLAAGESAAVEWTVR